MKKFIAIAVLAVAVTMAFAQQKDSTQELDPREQSRKAIDNAMTEARAMAAAQKQAPVRSGLAPEELKKMKTADPLAIAARYKAAGVGQQYPTQDLFIFVSTSIPKEGLKIIGEQAKAAGAIVVLRGLLGQLGKPGLMVATSRALQPLIATGATVHIDPEAFGRYNVTAVPTFVIASKEEGCGTELCAKAYALAGDVTLEYALEQWSNRGGNIGKLAEIYLQRLSRNP